MGQQVNKHSQRAAKVRSALDCSSVGKVPLGPQPKAGPAGRAGLCSSWSVGPERALSLLLCAELGLGTAF